MVVNTVISCENNDDTTVRDRLLQIRANHAKNQKHDYSHVFREKTRFNLIRLACVIIGIEFAYAAETAFVSPLFLELGIEHQHMTMIWSLPPILGFILAPLMGSLSDKCRSPLGRRRPFILGLSITLLIGLILVAWGTDIGVLLGDKPRDKSTDNFNGYKDFNSSINQMRYTMPPESPATSSVPFYKWAAIITIIGSILLDFGSDNCQTPARTYLLDTCVSQDHTKGLSIFTVMAGFGAFLGYVLGAIDWETTQIGQLMGGNVKTIFTIVCIVLVITCVITLTSFREIPLSLIERDSLLKPLSQADIDREKHRELNVLHKITQNFFLVESDVCRKSHHSINNTSKQSMSLQSLTSTTPTEPITFRKYLQSIWKMPKAMKILCLLNLLAWMSITCYTLYFTDFVGECVFGGDPTAEVGSSKSLAYQAGLRFGCWGMAIFALSCAFHSMTVERLIQAIGLKAVNICGLLSFSVGMLILAIHPTKWGVLVWSITTGFMYSTVFTIPYLLMANYHASGIFRTVQDEESSPLKQTRGLGTDIAILSSMMFIAQITISLTIGPLIKVFETINAVIYAASFLGLCTTLVATKVIYTTD